MRSIKEIVTDSLTDTLGILVIGVFSYLIGYSVYYLTGVLLDLFS